LLCESAAPKGSDDSTGVGKLGLPGLVGCCGGDEGIYLFVETPAPEADLPGIKNERVGDMALPLPDSR
jgi:hypothetical protein